MIEVWFFLAWLNLNGGITQAGPFHTQSQCEYARASMGGLPRTSPCYQGVK